MKGGCTTLEKRAEDKTSKEPECWKHFSGPVEVTYVSVSRPGWYDIGIDGGGDIDLVDYKIVENEE